MQASLLALVLGLPLFFLPWTAEARELNKQLLLFVCAAVAGLSWLTKALVERRLEYRRTFANPIVLLFVALYAVSALFSQNRYSSLVGEYGLEKAGLSTVLAFAALYFVIIGTVKTATQVRRLFRAVAVSGFLVAVFGILQGIGVFLLPFDFAKAAGFNTVGTVSSMAVYLAFVVTVCSALLLEADPASPQLRGIRGRLISALRNGFLSATGVLSLFLIAVIDFPPVTIALGVASAVLVGAAFIQAKEVRGLGKVALPISALVIAGLLLLFRFPVSLGFPSEVMPSLKASADIAVKTLRESPLLGSGPATFSVDYAKHRSVDLNSTAFWNVRFDRSSSRYLTELATTGLLVTLSSLALVLFLAFSALRRVLKGDGEQWQQALGMTSVWSVMLIARLMHGSNLTLELAFWLSTALLAALLAKQTVTIDLERAPRASMGVSFGMIVALVVLASGVFVEGQRYSAEVQYGRALRADRANAPLDEVIEPLRRAVAMNPSNELFLRNLANALLTKAEREFDRQDVVERNKDESKKDYDARAAQAREQRLRNASALVQDAIAAAQRATQVGPGNVANWASLAATYQKIMGVTAGADAWAIAAFEKAIELEPANPELHLEIGKVYLTRSDTAARQSQQTKDETQKKSLEEGAAAELEKAERAFNRAIELKRDHAPAHYQLALVFDRQGKIKESITRMQALVAANPQDIGVGFQLALLYFRDGRKDDAVRLMESVVRLSSNFSNARWYLASMYEDRGELDKALAELEKVLELNPGAEAVQKRIAELQEKKTQPGLPKPLDEKVQDQAVGR